MGGVIGIFSCSKGYVLSIEALLQDSAAQSLLYSAVLAVVY